MGKRRRTTPQEAAEMGLRGMPDAWIMRFIRKINASLPASNFGDFHPLAPSGVERRKILCPFGLFIPIIILEIVKINHHMELVCI
jgi:hypothetical protein